MYKRVLGVLLVAMPCVALAADPASMSKKEIDAKFDQLFKAVDTDGDGKISKAEAELKTPAMYENFEFIDANHDGGLTKAEIKGFNAAQEKRRHEFKLQLEKADKNKNGMLTREEAKALPGLFEYFDEVDSNRDNQLSIQEVADFLRGGSNSAPGVAPHRNLTANGSNLHGRIRLTGSPNFCPVR